MTLRSGTKILVLCLVALSLSSCMEFFEILGGVLVGWPMPLVRAELGPPAWSGQDARGFSVDRFQLDGTYFVTPDASLTSMGTPSRSGAGGTEINVTVTYDESKRVSSVKAQDSEGNEIPLETIVRRKQIAPIQ